MAGRIALLFLPAVLLQAAACAGGADMPTATVSENELTIEEYFQLLQSIDDNADARVDALDIQLEETLASAASPEEETEALRINITELLIIAEGVLDEFKALDAPDEVESAHSEFVESGEDVLAALRDFSGRLEGMVSDAELEELLGLFQDASAAAADRLDHACFDLRDIADQNEIRVDLDCGQ